VRNDLSHSKIKVLLNLELLLSLQKEFLEKPL
jgi:hypothetical protein